MQYMIPQMAGVNGLKGFSSQHTSTLATNIIFGLSVFTST
jgi:hypothetical protein